MKANCKSLKLSILICCISVVLIVIFICILLKTNNSIIEIILNLLIGVFGSGCVALLMTIPAYNVSKRQLLERFYQEVRRLIADISQVDYLFSEYNEELLISYIRELKNKRIKEEYNKYTKDKMIIEDEKYKNGLIKEYLVNHTGLNEMVSRESLNKCANYSVNKDIVKIKNKAKEICEQYVKISELSTMDLSFMLGDMQFFIGSAPYKKIYYKTYQELFDLLDYISDEAYHLKRFIDGEGSEEFALETIFKLQKMIFDVDIDDNKDFKRYVISNKFVDKMLVNLEEFRADMYGIKPAEVQIHPVESITFNKKILNNMCYYSTNHVF